MAVGGRSVAGAGRQRCIGCKQSDAQLISLNKTCSHLLCDNRRTEGVEAKAEVSVTVKVTLLEGASTNIRTAAH